MATRTARCACGRVEIVVEDEPTLVAACHCDFCQMRTGSVLAVQAYFLEAQCEATGESGVYNGLEVNGVASQAGNAIDYHFCTTCGSTVFWTTAATNGGDIVGVAVGNFVDPQFGAPMREYYAILRHDWMQPVSAAEQFETFPEQGERLKF